MPVGNALVNWDWPHWGAVPYPINLFKMCYSQQAPTAPADFVWQRQLDIYGFPNVPWLKHQINNYFQTFNDKSGYAGKYHLRWDGKAGKTGLGFTGGIFNVAVKGGRGIRIELVGNGTGLEFSGTDGFVEFNIGETVQASVSFLTDGVPWDGTCRNMRLFRADDAADEAAGKLIRQEAKDYFKALKVRAIRTMDMNGVNNGSGALWKYRRKAEDFDWYGSSRYMAGAWVGDIAGANTFIAGLGSDHDVKDWQDGETYQGLVLHQQTAQASVDFGGRGFKDVVAIGGWPVTSPTGTVTDTIMARSNTFVYHGLLDKVIWNAINFQSGFGMDDGVPWEVIAEICIGVGCDCYITIPVNYTPDSIRSLGALMGKLLAGTGLTCYAELGNECWNGQFSQAQIMVELSRKLGFNKDVYIGRFSAQGMLHRRAMEAFAAGWREAGASMDYLRRVLGVQLATGNPAGIAPYLLEGIELSSYGYDTPGNRPVDHTDLVAAAPYVMGGTLQASYNWKPSVHNVSMLQAACDAADAYAGGGAGINTALAWVDNDMRRGVDNTGVPWMMTLSRIMTFMQRWNDLLDGYNKTRANPVRIGCYEGGTEIFWPNVDQCTALGVPAAYGSGTGTVSPNKDVKGGDRIRNMVIAWRNSPLASAFLQDYYSGLQSLSNIGLAGQYCHVLGSEANWGNQWGFYTPDSGLTAGLKAANAKPARLMRANGN
ncbi:hypothetical protein [Aestuariivirga sp.]|uniref:hypothetical protein n=1 Tax=Aestuariivirga sp. TaxID=2650926 RepID=UPI0039E6B056